MQKNGNYQTRKSLIKSIRNVSCLNPMRANKYLIYYFYILTIFQKQKMSTFFFKYPICLYVHHINFSVSSRVWVMNLFLHIYIIRDSVICAILTDSNKKLVDKIYYEPHKKYLIDPHCIS